MFATRRKRKKNSSILESQKVSGSKSAGASRNSSWKIAAKAALGMFVVFLCWVVLSRTFDKIVGISTYVARQALMTPKEWHIVVRSSTGNLPADEVRKEAEKSARKNLKFGHPNELAAMASDLAATSLLEHVKVVRSLADTILISADQRHPIMQVLVADAVLYLTSDGTVFSGPTGPKSPAFQEPPITLSGIFDDRPNASLDSSRRLVTTSDERRHLIDAIELSAKLTELQIPLKAISFQKFRGFSLRLLDDTEIVFGGKPFDYKTKKLLSILDGLRKDGLLAAKIELDYDGKAFVKERKL